MAMEYINYIKAKANLTTATKAEAPVLSEEDEQFLNQITSDGAPPELPPRPVQDAQIALMAGAQNIPLPETPQDEITEEPLMVDQLETTAKQEKKKSSWSWLRRDSRDATRKATAAGLEDVAKGLKTDEATAEDDGVVDDPEAKKEEEDMTMVLERLNLAAVNNRVFSISDETQQLLQQFNQVFKDLVNGVPTAYDDLESLLTNGDRQLQKTFSSLPSFLQKLIEQLPQTMTKGFAPEIMAAAAERAEKSGVNMENVGKATAAAKKFGFKTPALRDLIGKPGAVAGMLRSVMTYLRARFPAFMGLNVLWSLALFVLLLVFWYCHKRGREVRLEKERLLTEAEVANLEKEYAPTEQPTTTAPAGASMEDVEAGIREVESIRRAVAEPDVAPGLTSPSALSTTVQPAEQVGI